LRTKKRVWSSVPGVFT
jgi:hypothetical protein